MIQLLKELSLPTISIIVSLFLLAVLKELLLLLKSYRSKAAEIVLEKELKEIDSRIEEFYLPLSERFKLTRLINETTSMWIENDEYVNSALNICSDNDRTLRDMVVLKIFLPLNSEIENIILNKYHWKHPDDETNYNLILQHYIIWRALEQTRLDGQIKNYEASKFLSFPNEEIGRHYELCNNLLNERELMRTNIKNFRTHLKKEKTK